MPASLTAGVLVTRSTAGGVSARLPAQAAPVTDDGAFRFTSSVEPVGMSLSSVAEILATLTLSTFEMMPYVDDAVAGVSALVPMTPVLTVSEMVAAKLSWFTADTLMLTVWSVA